MGLPYVERSRPSESTVAKFIGYMASGEGNAWNTKGLKISTMGAYLGAIRAEVQKANPAADLRMVFESDLVNRIWRGANRILGSAKQKSRVAKLEDLRKLVRGLGEDEKEACIRLLILLAFWGALRMGNVAVADGAKEDDVVSLKDCTLEGSRLIVKLRHTKTIQCRDRLHVVGLAKVDHEPELCPVRAFEKLTALRSGLTAVRKLGPIARYGPYKDDVWTYTKVVRWMQGRVDPVEETELEKGHLTGHSFRRGFMVLGLSLNVDLNSLRMHGDWKQLNTLVDYTRGAAVLVDVVRRLEDLR